MIVAKLIKKLNKRFNSLHWMDRIMIAEVIVFIMVFASVLVCQ